jgi:cyclopropane fatty-acyl-phospholipid synthase-like methyltransferase
MGRETNRAGSMSALYQKAPRVTYAADLFAPPDRCMASTEKARLAEIRSRLAVDATGDVLEVGAGTCGTTRPASGR